MMAETHSQPRVKVTISGIDRSYVNAKFNQWGHWIEKHKDVNGYPRLDNVSAYLSGGGGGTKGSRVLCLDMPEEISLTHVRIIRALDERERATVYVFYAVRMRDDGTLWPLHEKLATIGVRKSDLREILDSARMKFLGLK